MNWIVILLFGIAVFFLIYFIIKRNKKDEADFEREIKNDYPKPKERIGEIDTEDSMH
jgi:phosphotransferase system  glucose/maltose/N-acetylglucosamine-specific IIC component